MRIDWWTLGLQTINVLVLVWLLSRFLFKPVAKIIADRQQAAAALMQDAASARDAAERERQRAADEAAALDARRSQALSEVSAEADRVKASLLAGARAETDALRAAAAAEIEATRRDAAQGDAARATGFALEIAARLLARLPPEAQVEGFIDPLAAAVRALPRENRVQVGGLRLIAPRPLSEREFAHCRAALSAALGFDPALHVEVDPALIAGLEIEAPHAIVRNSFRHDLATLRDELLSRDGKHHA
jgi:F-type H+-transporting ATPase subunit b